MAEDVQLYYRDGASKRRRKLPALDPATAPVDERTVADWLAFLQELARELKYFGLDNQEAGVWAPPFYPDSVSYEQAKRNAASGTGDPARWPENWRKTIENYLNDPEHFPLTDEQRQRIAPPHHTLMLVFLQLLREVQGRINDFPRRLLDFYYREYLQFQPKSPKPDQLHAWVELARGVKQVRLPAGSKLDAGKGPDKVPLVYATDRDLFFNPAKIAQVHSLYRDTTGALWAAPDATKVLSAAIAAGQESTGWKTFGAEPAHAPENTVFPARTGLAICSPVLWLEGGTRTIVLTLNFTSKPHDVLKEAFSFHISTPEGMKKIEGFKTPSLSGNKVTVTLNLDESFPPIVPLSREYAGDLYWETKAPLLAIVLFADTEDWRSHFVEFQSLVIESLDLKVNVGFADENRTTMGTGLPNCLIQNDEGTLEPKKAFEPFTNRPKQGRNFYLTHPELSAKPLDKISIAFSWADMPWGEGGAEAYYKSYEEFTEEGDPFENSRKASLLVKENPNPLIGSFDLISPPDSIITSDSIKTERYAFTPFTNSVVDADWYLILRLLGDFGNDLYPVLLNRQIRQGIENKDKLKTNLNPPYVPKSNGLKVAYSSTINILKSGDEFSCWDFLYHLHPFGYQRLTGCSVTLLPAYGAVKKDQAPPYPDSGELYIGLSGLEPPQTLSLLIQMVEGSANPDRPAAIIPWSYLGQNGWQNLDDTKQIIEDKTTGLLQSGLLLLDIPADAAVDNPLLPGGLTWLRAAIGAHTDTVADIQSLHTQALRATLLSPEKHPLHLQNPLPPNTVKGLLHPPVGIAKIHQPYSSQGGAAEESESDYFTRCSERLRHKQRALTPWDYEHLVLEAFPNVYLAKCIPAAGLDKGGAGTTVQLLVVPDIRNARAYNPFEPKVAAGTLAAIGQYLQPLLPPLTKVSVRNAAYEQVQVRALVRLKTGYYDTGYYLEQTNRVIQHYLCPWAFDEGGDIVMGGRLYVSNLVNLVENLPWVEYIKNLYIKNKSPWGMGQLAGMQTTNSYLVTTGPDYIWTSAPEHYITVLPPEGTEPKGTGIEYMIVEYDFLIK